MRVLIAGAGIAGPTTALALHAVGIEAQVVESATGLRPLGVGINLLPPAVRELTELGSAPHSRRPASPVTGTLLASHPMLGVIAPLIGGVSAAGAWVSEPTGMLGYIERFSASSLTPQARNASAARPGQGLPDGGHWRPDLLLGARQQRIRDPHSSGPGGLRVA